MDSIIKDAFRSQAKEKLIEDHWSYIWKLLVHHHIGQSVRSRVEREYKRGFSDGWDGKPESPVIGGIDNFHYLTAYKHGQKHREEDESK